MKEAPTRTTNVPQHEMKTPRGPELQNELLGVRMLTDQLDRSVQSLPRVEPDGSSECPFAEKLFARKEELEHKLTGSVQRVQQYLPGLEEEILRCRRNLDQIGVDARTLKLKKAIDQYSKAELDQRDQCHAAVRDRDAILRVLPRAEMVLGLARASKYPGKIPEDTFGPICGTPFLTGNRSNPVPSTALPDLGGLISLGPIGS